MNLDEATKRVFQSKGKELREAFNLYNHPPIENPQSDSIPQLNQNNIESRETALSSSDISVDRQYKFGTVKELHSKGFSIRHVLLIHQNVKSSQNYFFSGLVDWLFSSEPFGNPK